ncbi:neuronal acetylcholine receptor subunit alpha-7-like [Babylonia areolata]|uniref:neuronal acetylcholine receptor subunit alpha-7-like n=1 Tax=Babylonia areolata TaxID=304850 RepID=UPI003FCF3302
MMYSKLGLCVTVLFILLSMGSISAESPNAYRHRLEALRTHLLSNYSGHFAPFQKEGEQFSVHVMFTLAAIFDLNAAYQLLKTMVSLTTVWTDTDLRWNKTEVGSPGEGIHHVGFRAEEIWTPRLMTVNTADNIQVMNHYDNLLVYYNGECTGQLSLHLSTTCQVDVTYYPFDTQHCKVIFTSPFGDNLNLTGSVLKFPLHDLIEKSGEWEVEKIISSDIIIISSNVYDASFVEFQLTLRRHFLFYVFTVLVPMMIMSVTGACGFLLPMQCGEKVSFQVSIMVSLSIFLSFVNDSMPTTSTSISRLAVYVDLLLLQSGLSLLATVTMLRGHYHREKLDQEQKERKTFNTSEAPEPQNVAREVTNMGQKDGGWQTVSSRIRRFWSWLRNVIRRSYCCCLCCMSPEYMNVFFFILFLSTTLAGPLVFLV